MSVPSTVHAPTLADALFTRRSATNWRTDALLVVGFSLFVALTARISIELSFTPVPITGQTLGVLLTGALLGSRRGALALLVYLAEGAAGLPVFAGGAAGFARLLGPTGGYLLAYPLAAGLVGLLAERGWDRSIWRAGMTMLLGNLLIYLIAVPWLSWFVGSLTLALAKGMLPFIVGDALKIALAAVALPGGWALLRRSL
ncbi:MAG: biotin transporter BioY [Chloroflexi bacterium]|nr:MAG: biotin transporter BioY [Chloroflexota bacterium]